MINFIINYLISYVPLSLQYITHFSFIPSIFGSVCLVKGTLTRDFRPHAKIFDYEIADFVKSGVNDNRCVDQRIQQGKFR
jgi:hypothetical protein